MIGKEFETEGLVHGPEAMQLDTLVVVNIGALFLGHRKHCLNMQPPDTKQALQITLLGSICEKRRKRKLSKLKVV